MKHKSDGNVWKGRRQIGVKMERGEDGLLAAGGLGKEKLVAKCPLRSQHELFLKSSLIVRWI